MVVLQLRNCICACLHQLFRRALKALQSKTVLFRSGALYDLVIAPFQGVSACISVGKLGSHPMSRTGRTLPGSEIIGGQV